MLAQALAGNECFELWLPSLPLHDSGSQPEELHLEAFLRVFAKLSDGSDALVLARPLSLGQDCEFLLDGGVSPQIGCCQGLVDLIHRCPASRPATSPDASLDASPLPLWRRQLACVPVERALVLALCRALRLFDPLGPDLLQGLEEGAGGSLAAADGQDLSEAIVARRCRRLVWQLPEARQRTVSRPRCLVLVVTRNADHLAVEHCPYAVALAGALAIEPKTATEARCA